MREMRIKAYIFIYLYVLVCILYYADERKGTGGRQDFHDARPRTTDHNQDQGKRKEKKRRRRGGAGRLLRSFGED